MSLTIYKPGQGYWTRLMSAIGLALLVLMGVAWLWKLLATTKFGNLPSIYVQAGVALLVISVFGALGYWLIGVNPRAVDFMIATETEMKKVNWSTRREVIGSTWVVISLTVFLSILCFGLDSGFAWIFQQVGVLETGG